MFAGFRIGFFSSIPCALAQLTCTQLTNIYKASHIEHAILTVLIKTKLNKMNTLSETKKNFVFESKPAAKQLLNEQPTQSWLQL